MIKQKLKSVKGITLTSLAIAVIVLLTITAIIIYNIKDNLKVKNLQQLQSDIENLRDKVSNYYMENGTIPAKSEYSNTKNIETISEAVDTGKFLVLDLSAIENLTLNYGKDYENVKKLSTFQSGQALTSQEMQNNTDLYIINETSHNIFYVKGIDIEGETYYTDYTIDDVDKKAVDLRYIEGVKIPDGYYYVSGTKDTGITIKNSDNTERYKWIVENDEITEVPSDVNLGTNYSWDFIESVNHYKGYYKNTSNNKVIILETDNWSPIYDKEGIYRDKNGDTANIPQVFCVSTTPGENTISDGLVAKDINNNEWVWIEVPKNIMPADLTFSNQEDYDTLTTALKEYANPYTKGSVEQTYYWKDEWFDKLATTYDGINEFSEIKFVNSEDDFNTAKDYYGTIYKDNTGTEVVESYEKGTTYYAKITEKLDDTLGCGLTYNEYKETYQKMLKSLYNNGGFWIGRYEAGIEGTTRTDLSNARNEHTDITDSSPKAISQKDAIPYSFIKCNEAQKLAKDMAPDTTKTSSLLFGIQWDLVCKFIEEKEVEKLGESNRTNIIASINSDSGDWGNYADKTIKIDSNNAKQYVTDSGWTTITGEKSASSILLSTGASNKAKKLNIYDLAGNVHEWTLERNGNPEYAGWTSVLRGGFYSANSLGYSVSRRGGDTGFLGKKINETFRPALY